MLYTAPQRWIGPAKKTHERMPEGCGMSAWRHVDLENRLIYLEARHTKAGRKWPAPLNRNAYKAVVGRKQFRDEHAPTNPCVFAGGTEHASGT